MRSFLRFLLVLVLVLAIGWLGLWWYAEGRINTGFRQEEASLRAQGWTISHGPTARSTSPLVARFTVTDLRLTPPQSAGAPVSITVPQASFSVHAADPGTLVIDLPTHWSASLADGPSFTLRFDRIGGRMGFDPGAALTGGADPVRSLRMTASGIRIDSENTNFTLASVDSVSTHIVRDPTAGVHGTALSVREHIRGFALSPIFVTLGDLPFEGKLHALDLALDLSGPAIGEPNGPLTPGLAPLSGNAAAVLTQSWDDLAPILHPWAKAGGHGRYRLHVAVGPLDARAKGTFGFDSASQPQAKGDLTADGISAFLGDLGNDYPALLDPVSRLTTQLGPYLVKGPKGGQRLSVKLALKGGTVSANGQSVGTVPKLVWPQGGQGKTEAKGAGTATGQQ